MNINDFFINIPKIDLHVHLEGSIRPETLQSLAKIDSSLSLKEIFPCNEKIYPYKGASGFFALYPKICQAIQTLSNLEFVTKAFLKDQHAQNVKYQEVFYSPFADLPNFNLDQQMDAINNALEWGRTTIGIDTKIIIDVNRFLPISEIEKIVKWMCEVHPKNVIGFGIGGIENHGLPKKFAQVFQQIHNQNFGAFPHAGEQLGPSIIWDTIQLLKPDRIGHGFNAVKDPDLISHLQKSLLPLDVCPLSNLVLGFCENLKNHPMHELLEKEVMITFNSDDPGLMNFTLSEQYAEIHKVKPFTLEILLKLAQNSINASFLPENMKSQYLTTFSQKMCQLAEISHYV